MAATHKPHEPTPDSPEWDSFDPPSNQSIGAKTWADLEGDVLADGSSGGSWEDDPKFYRDMVEYHDKVIGRLLSYLENQGLQEDTLVVYLGDNGSPADVCSMMINFQLHKPIRQSVQCESGSPGDGYARLGYVA